MSDKIRYPRALALQVVRELHDAIYPNCIPVLDEAGQPRTNGKGVELHLMVVAGSLRRGKPDVGDIEFLYVPRIVEQDDPADFFSREKVNLVTTAILDLERTGIIERRKSKTGSTMFGPQNKYLRHIGTGIPIDFFETTEANWYNYLVCRTGPAESNTAIAMAAQRKGWQWTPYGQGFQQGRNIHPVNSEEEVFEFVGLPYREPRERN